MSAVTQSPSPAVDTSACWWRAPSASSFIQIHYRYAMLTSAPPFFSICFCTQMVIWDVPSGSVEMARLNFDMMQGSSLQPGSPLRNSDYPYYKLCPTDCVLYLPSPQSHLSKFSTVSFFRVSIQGELPNDQFTFLLYMHPVLRNIAVTTHDVPCERCDYPFLGLRYINRRQSR